MQNTNNPNANNQSANNQMNWKDLKTKIKSRWSRLSDDDLSGVENNLDQLSGKIQKTYGYGKEQAEREFSEFRKKINEDNSQSQNANTSGTSKPSVKNKGSEKDNLF